MNTRLAAKTSNGQPRRFFVGAPPRYPLLASLLRGSDLVVMALAFLCATIIVPYQLESVSLNDFFSMRLKVINFAVFVGLLLLWHLSFRSFGLYDASHAWLDRRRLGAVVGATALCTVFLGLGSIPFEVELVTPAFLVAFWCSSTVAVGGMRLLMGLELKHLSRKAASERKVLIVGTGLRAVRFAAKLERNPESGYCVVGFVDDEWPGLQRFLATGRHLVCDIKNFPHFLRDGIVDEVVFALPIEALGARRAEVLGACELYGVTIRFLTSVFNDLEVCALKREGGSDPVLLTVYNGTIDGWSQLGKRMIDVSVSLLLLVLLSPVFLATALLIQLTSPGPSFFRQERVGLNKRRFQMLKFRTMDANAEEKICEIEHLNEAGGPVFKLKQDPRVTPIGRFLRRSSIDELPQLLNVLKGDMSLVGPRPLPMRDFEGFYDEQHRRRFSVRPGLSGLWQVSGRSSIAFEEWMELDLRYIDQWSLWLDLKILLLTVPAVLRREGAE